MGAAGNFDSIPYRRQIAGRDFSAKALSRCDLLGGNRDAVCKRRPAGGVLLLAERDALLFQALHSLCVDCASIRDHSAGVQDCCDRLVASS